MCAHFLELWVLAGVTDHGKHVVKYVSNHFNLGSLVKIVVLIPHSRCSQCLVVFFLLLSGYDFVQVTHLCLHIMLVGRDGAEFLIYVLVYLVQFVKYFWIKNSLTYGLRLNSLLTIWVQILVLPIREIPIIRSRLVIVIHLTTFFSIMGALIHWLWWSKRNLPIHVVLGGRFLCVFANKVRRFFWDSYICNWDDLLSCRSRLLS